MADTTVPSNLRVKQWDDKYFMEYIRDNRYSRYMGTSENSIIQVKENLMKKSGDTVYFQLINRLTGAGVTNNATLEGNEEDLTQRSDSIVVNLYRHGVRVPEYEEQASPIDLREAARATLMDWSKEHTRDKIHAALSSINGVAYGSASEANKDAWLVDNADRCLFGAAKGNNASNDHSAALAQIDNTADKLTTGTLSLAKRMAKTANPKIRPMRVNGDEEWYVLLAPSQAFRDFKADTTMTAANREAWTRGEGNPLFTDGDLIWDGVIVREIPELPILTGVGAGGIDVAPCYLLGAQALGVAYAQRWNSRTETFDYGTKYGVAIQSIYDVKKLTFGSGAGDTDDLKDNGLLTLFVAGVADA